jgi:hypothetical protein
MNKREIVYELSERFWSDMIYHLEDDDHYIGMIISALKEKQIKMQVLDGEKKRALLKEDLSDVKTSKKVLGEKSVPWDVVKANLGLDQIK